MTTTYAVLFIVKTSFYGQWLLSFSTVLLISYVHPYKRKKDNCIDTFWFAEFTTLSVVFQYQTTVGNHKLNSTIAIMSLLLPLLYTIIILLWYIVRRMKFTACYRHCLETIYRCLRLRKIDALPLQNHEQLPDRLLNSAEYRPLIQK